MEPPVDVLAAGVCLFNLLTGREPFRAIGDVFHQRICKKPVQATKYSLIAEDAIKLVARMIDLDPATRISIPQIKSHDWLKGKTASDEEVLQYFTEVVGK